MSKKTRIWLLVVILIIATFFRFYHFTSTPPGLYPDEAIDGNNAVEAVQAGHLQTFYVEDNGREGLYVNLIAIFLKVWPIYEPWVVRLPAAIAGTLTVLGLYFLAAELFGYEVALLAAFFLATSFWHINFSRIGFRAILAPLLLIWSLYFLLKAFKTVSKSAAWWYAILAGIIYSLGFYTYIAYRITPLLFLAFIPFYRNYPDFWKRAGSFIVVTFLVAAPIGWYFVHHPSAFFGRTAQISVTNSSNPVSHFAVNLVKTALMFNIHGDDNWRHNISGAPELFWPVGIFFLIGIALAIYLFYKNRKKKSSLEFGVVLTFVWMILAILPAAASDEGLPHALRSILALPPALIFAALGGMWFYRTAATNPKYKRASQIIAWLVLVCLALLTYIQYFVVWAQNPNVQGAFNANYVDLGHQINSLPQGTQKYIVVEAGGVIDRGIPVPADTVMFITDSFTVQDQQAHNIHYLLQNQKDQIPPGTPSSSIFYIQ